MCNILIDVKLSLPFLPSVLSLFKSSARVLNLVQGDEGPLVCLI